MATEEEVKGVDDESPIGADDGLTVKRNTTLLQAVFNLTKSAIGLGALFLPGNVRRMGLLGGTLMIAVGAATSGMSLHLLGKLAHDQGVGDYFELGMAAFGPRMALVDTIVLVVFQLGGLIAYSKFAGSYLSAGIQALMMLRNPDLGDEIPWWRGYRFLSMLLSVVAIFPLSLLRDMSILGYTSLAGMLCIFYNALLTVVDFAVHAATDGLDRSLYTVVRVRSDFLSAFSSIMFAFVNQFTMVALMPALMRPSKRRRGALVGVSSTVVTGIYLAMGVCGYLHFGDLVPEDILSAGTSVWYAIGMLLVSVILICSYPLQLDPTRSACEHLLQRAIGMQPSANEGKVRQWLRRNRLARHVAWTVVLVAIPEVIAITAVQYVMPILELTSSACGAMLVYVLPAVYFLRLTSRLVFFAPLKHSTPSADKLNGEDANGDAASQDDLIVDNPRLLAKPMQATKSEMAMAYINLVFGLAVCVGGTVGSFISIIGSLLKKS